MPRPFSPSKHCALKRSLGTRIGVPIEKVYMISVRCLTQTIRVVFRTAFEHPPGATTRRTGTRTASGIPVWLPGIPPQGGWPYWVSGFCMVLPTITSIGAMLFMDNIHEYRVDFGAMGTLAAWPTPTARATWLWPTYTPGVRQLARRPRPGGSARPPQPALDSIDIRLYCDHSASKRTAT